MPGSYTRTDSHRYQSSKSAERTNKIKADRLAVKIAEYNLNPVTCGGCGHPIPFLKRNRNKFCSKSCGAKKNNSNRTVESRLAQQETIRTKYRGDGSDYADIDYCEYKKRCGFGFIKYHTIPGGHLVDELGWFHPKRNPTGVARDHMLSRSEAYRLGVDPVIVSHPANCQIITQVENAEKGALSSISLEDLLARIYLWRG